MTIGAGKAFAVDGNGKTAKHVPVVKQWGQLDGRDFLVEEVSYDKVADQLQKLPPANKYEGSSLLRRGKGQNVLAGLKQLVPKRYAKTTPDPLAKPKRMAKAKLDVSPSFVMDYVLSLTDQTDFTFSGDTTYYVSGSINLDGITTFESGTVLKFPEDGSGVIYCSGDIACSTTPSRPAILTSENDDSVGESILSSSGMPAVGIGSDLFLSGSNPYYISNFNVGFVNQALVVDGNTPYAEIANSQFINCGWAIPININEITLRNLLFVNCETISIPDGGDLTIHGEHLTVDHCNDLIFDGGATYAVNLTNSILTFTTNINNAILQNCLWLSNAGGIYQSGGAGSHYLAPSSPYRNVGTTNLDAMLLADIQAMTTYAPPVSTPDSDTPDLGYHYPTQTDYDRDGMEDGWEDGHFGNLNQTATGDFDGDGLTNFYEYLHGLNPANQDSDDDGLIDQLFQVRINRPKTSGLP